MTALFPRWADSVLRLTLVVFFFGFVLGVPALLMAWVRTPWQTDISQPLAQPIQFDHRHHVRDDAISCLYCHYDAMRAPMAGVPEPSVCMGCHAQIWKDSPQLEPVRQSYLLGKPLVWRRVHHLPDFVFFNHAIHVQKGVGCETCHGRVDKMASVYKVVSLQMQWCLDCHRDPARYLRPIENATDMGYRPTEPQSVIGKRLVRLYSVDTSTNCSTCHR